MLTVKSFAHGQVICSRSSHLLTVKSFAHGQVICSRSSHLLTVKSFAHGQVICSHFPSLNQFAQTRRTIQEYHQSSHCTEQITENLAVLKATSSIENNLYNMTESNQVSNQSTWCTTSINRPPIATMLTDE